MIAVRPLLDRFAGVSTFVATVVTVAVVTAVALVWVMRGSDRTITVDFKATNSVYVGSDVKVLGVPVGEVTALRPLGDLVRATVKVDEEYDLPADVRAAVISPAIVGDRYVQLAPAYTGGPKLRDGASIPVERTAVPIELDEVYSSLNQLSVALGPNGVNETGALSRLIDSTAVQLEGQGGQLNQTIRDFGRLSRTLENNSDELFGSVTEVEQFVSVLRENDATVRDFNDSTAELAAVLEGEREDLAGTLAALGTALQDVDTFVKDNEESLTSNVAKITRLSKILRERQGEFDELLVAAPTALANVALTYNGTSGTLDNRADFKELLTGPFLEPAGLLCNLLDESREDGGLCGTLAGLLPNVGGGLPGAGGGSGGLGLESLGSLGSLGDLGRVAPATAPRTGATIAQLLEVPR